jgi:hypothetical protein
MTYHPGKQDEQPYCCHPDRPMAGCQVCSRWRRKPAPEPELRVIPVIDASLFPDKNGRCQMFRPREVPRLHCEVEESSHA